MQVFACHNGVVTTENELPEPECGVGFSERQIVEIIGERQAEFQRYMLMKTYARCNGSAPCVEAHGSVYYPSDVYWFFRHRR